MTTAIPDIYGMPDNSYLQIAAVLMIVSKTREELFAEIDAGTFPRPREINNGIPIWLVGDIKGWLIAQNTVETPSV